MFGTACIWPTFNCFAGFRSGDPVVFVIPNGFRGPVRIVENQAAPEVPHINHEYRLTIPKSGFVIVKDIGFLTELHNERAVFENGKEIPSLTDRQHGDELAFILGSSTYSSVPEGDGYTQWEQRFVGAWREVYEEGGLGAEPGTWKPKSPPKNAVHKEAHRRSCRFEMVK